MTRRGYSVWFLTLSLIYGIHVGAGLVARGNIARSQPAIDKYGLPTCGISEEGRKQGDFILAYDGRTRTAKWALEFIPPGPADKEVDRAGMQFKADKDIPPEIRAAMAAYAHSGYDIGHVAPAADHTSDADDLKATFTLTNAFPQDPALNRHQWAMLERYVRKLAEDADVQGVWVVTAPLWIAETEKAEMDIHTIGEPPVWVPTHVGKSVLIELQLNGKLTHRMLTWIIPNSNPGDGAFSDFQTSVDEFEEALGADIWPAGIPSKESQALESAK